MMRWAEEGPNWSRCQTAGVHVVHVVAQLAEGAQGLHSPQVIKVCQSAPCALGPTSRWCVCARVRGHCLMRY